MKTERITVFVTPEEKARIDARAGALNIPAGELLRRAVATYGLDDLETNEVELESLADELERFAGVTGRELDRALAALDRMRAALRQSGSTAIR